MSTRQQRQKNYSGLIIHAPSLPDYKDWLWDDSIKFKDHVKACCDDDFPQYVYDCRLLVPFPTGTVNKDNPIKGMVLRPYLSGTPDEEAIMASHLATALLIYANTFAIRQIALILSNAAPALPALAYVIRRRDRNVHLFTDTPEEQIFNSLKDDCDLSNLHPKCLRVKTLAYLMGKNNNE